MSGLTNVSREDYEEKIAPKIQNARRALAELYLTCYKLNENLAWVANPDFLRTQRHLDVLEQALQRVAGYEHELPDLTVLEE